NDLEKLAPVLAVHGNMDPYEVKAKLPEMDVVEFYGWRIGVVHDPGALWGMGEMRRIAEENRLNILVFGHTHRHFVKWEDDVLF
ncbi:MAG: metallophosphoesterase family protein, partial [Candidatus Brockarchaeota archaeon]|nr:metallophosphoesterase family protein [Candidatus Brockarchaeota archaeon]